MGKVIAIILLIFSCYGAYKHFNKFKGEKIPEHKLTAAQKEERAKNKKLATLEDQPSDNNSSIEAKQKVPPQITEFVNNQMEQWSNLTPGEKNELRHLSSRIEQRLPFGNYEKTLVKKLEDRNIFDAIRQNNASIIKNTDQVIHETNQYDTSLNNSQEQDILDSNHQEDNPIPVQEPDAVDPIPPSEENIQNNDESSSPNDSIVEEQQIDQENLDQDNSQNSPELSPPSEEYPVE